ncbi:MAG TPA: hypothetical protein VF894_00245 [Anaeromyxobacter sp.]
MTCEEARPLLLDLQRASLPPELEREVRLHLDTCAACARASAEEAVLTGLLERRLPRYPATGALKRRLAALVSGGAPVVPLAARRRSQRLVAPALVAAALVAITATLVERSSREVGALAALTSEAVNDHLRVLVRDRPVDLESGELHQVKPWFEGKLDFAPSVPSPVAPEMRLEGGAVGYFVDRKAAVLVYRLRRHVVTLLVFRADGLSGADANGVGNARSPLHRTLRGFDVFLWRSGELGYALVADVDPVELSGIAAKLAAETRSPALPGG